MDTVADLAVVETAVSPTAISQHLSSGIGATLLFHNIVRRVLVQHMLLKHLRIIFVLINMLHPHRRCKVNSRINTELSRAVF